MTTKKFITCIFGLGLIIAWGFGIDISPPPPVNTSIGLISIQLCVVFLYKKK